MSTEQPQPINEAAGGASDVECAVKRGDVVTIRKGAIVRSLRRGEYVLTRNQKVKVNLVITGYTHDLVTRPAEVIWAGSGGYWCYANLADIVPTPP